MKVLVVINKDFKNSAFDWMDFTNNVLEVGVLLTFHMTGEQQTEEGNFDFIDKLVHKVEYQNIMDRDLLIGKIVANICTYPGNYFNDSCVRRISGVKDPTLPVYFGYYKEYDTFYSLIESNESNCLFTPTVVNRIFYKEDLKKLLGNTPIKESD